MPISNFQTQNGPFVLNKFFSQYKLLLLSFIYWPFSLCKIEKKFLQQIHFVGQKWSICPKQMDHFFFFWKIKSFSSTCWSLSLCKILQKFLEWIQSYEDASFLHPKQPICPNDFFSENFLISLVRFIHAYCHGKKTKSDINVLMKYSGFNNWHTSHMYLHLHLLIYT